MPAAVLEQLLMKELYKFLYAKMKALEESKPGEWKDPQKVYQSIYGNISMSHTATSE